MGRRPAGWVDGRSTPRRQQNSSDAACGRGGGRGGGGSAATVNAEVAVITPHHPSWLLGSAVSAAKGTREEVVGQKRLRLAGAQSRGSLERGQIGEGKWALQRHMPAFHKTPPHKSQHETISPPRPIRTHLSMRKEPYVKKLSLHIYF